MPKERGRYKRYLFDPTLKKPESTISYHKRKLNALNQSVNTCADEHSNERELSNIQTSNELPTNQVEIHDQEVVNANSFDENYNLFNVYDQSNQFSSNEESDSNQDSNLCIELDEFINDSEISREELAAAFLAAFYNGKCTQSSLNDFLVLSNMFLPFKLPTSFNGLVNILLGRDTLIKATKTWFCCVCLTLKEVISNRFQRNCEK